MFLGIPPQRTARHATRGPAENGSGTRRSFPGQRRLKRCGDPKEGWHRSGTVRSATWRLVTSAAGFFPSTGSKSTAGSRSRDAAGRNCSRSASAKNIPGKWLHVQMDFLVSKRAGTGSGFAGAAPGDADGRRVAAYRDPCGRFRAAFIRSRPGIRCTRGSNLCCGRRGRRNRRSIGSRPGIRCTRGSNPCCGRRGRRNRRSIGSRPGNRCSRCTDRSIGPEHLHAGTIAGKRSESRRKYVAICCRY